MPSKRDRLTVNTATTQSEIAVPCQVRVISGCLDEQTANDVNDCADFYKERGVDPANIMDGSSSTILSGDGDAAPNMSAGGALTHAFLSLMQEQRANNTTISLMNLLVEVRKTMKDFAFNQIPQICCSQPTDLKAAHYLLRNPNHEEGVSTLKALLIGINYEGANTLDGCVNDVLAVKEFLISQGFMEENIQILVDHAKEDSGIKPPTKANILAAIDALVRDAHDTDSLFFHFSGHGHQVVDKSGDEKDNKDEVIVPSDFMENGFITDDNLLQQLVLPLPPGVVLNCIFDCCHSGTILDLPFCLKATIGFETKERVIACPNDNFRFDELLQYVKDHPNPDSPMGSGYQKLQTFSESFRNVIPI